MFLALITALAVFYGQHYQDKYLHDHFFPNKREGVFVDIGAKDEASYNTTYFFEKERGWKGLCVDTPFKAGSFLLNDLLVQNNFARIDFLKLHTKEDKLKILKSIDFDRFDIDVIAVENSRDDPTMGKFLSSKGYVFVKKLKKVDEIYKKKRLEPVLFADRPTLDFIRQFLPENPVIVEAGAHIGFDTFEMSKRWKKGQIYAFEPSPEVYPKLVKKCQRKKNVKTFQLALGDRNGISEFFTSYQTEGAKQADVSDAQGSLLPPSKENWIWDSISFNKPIQVQVMTLDTWAKKQGVKKIDFLWLDMQGGEFNMLKASPEMLKTVQVIQTEVSRKPYYEGLALLDEIKTWLEGQGFMAIYITPEDHGDALFVRR